MGKKQIIIIGHKNPDTDSIAAAVAYSEYKKITTGKNYYIPASAGLANARTGALFEKFKLQLPRVIKDISPVAKDIANTDVETVHSDDVLLSAMEKLQKNHLYRIPVVDEGGIYKGMISLFDQTFRFFRDQNSSVQDSDSLLSRRINTSINLASKTLKAEKLSVIDGDKVELMLVYVAAMSLSSFREHVSNHDPRSLAIVVGDREDIQFMAVELKVRLLIVTGNAHISETVAYVAKRNGISILKTGFDSATTVRRLKFSTPIELVMQENVKEIGIRDKLSDVKHNILRAQEDIFPVLTPKKEFKGTIQKNSLELDESLQLILVDHNNFDQAVDGASELPLLEILDHHHLDMPVTTTPVTVFNDTVGSTCTLVAEKFKLADIKPSQAIAGILMGGILSDTLILKSPTTTQRDRIAVKWLEKVAKYKVTSFEKEIFKAGSLIASTVPSKLLTEDKKNYTAGEYTISIAQVEEFSFKEFNDKYAKLLAAVKKIKESEALDMFALLVTNVETQNSLLLVDGKTDLVDIIPYKRIDKFTFDLPGVLSRKKQLIPELMKVISENNQ